MTFLESLRAQGPSYDLLASQCKTTETPIFADLCWGKELDFTTITSDPGIEGRGREGHGQERRQETFDR